MFSSYKEGAFQASPTLQKNYGSPVWGKCYQILVFLTSSEAFEFFFQSKPFPSTGDTRKRIFSVVFQGFIPSYCISFHLIFSPLRKLSLSFSHYLTNARKQLHLASSYFRLFPQMSTYTVQPINFWCLKSCILQFYEC